MSSRNSKCIIERGASWTLEETKLLLALWGQDLVRRQSTNSKRSKEVYETISENFSQNGFDRTAEQVRTRVFNMIAEYRRIKKEPTPERVKKCIFFEPLDRIYAAKSPDEIQSILNDYDADESACSPSSNAISTSERGDGSVSDGEATNGNDIVSNTSNQTTGNNADSKTNCSAANATAQAGSNNNSSSVNPNETSNSATTNKLSDVTIVDTNLKDDLQSTTGSAPSKKMRLESPKSSNHQSHANQTTITSINITGNSTSNPQDNAATNPSTSSKQTKSANTSTTPSATSVPLLATTIGGAPISSSSTIRQQSLLMPHGAASTIPSTSTPITKLVTSANNSTNNNTPSYININSTKLPIIRTNQLIGHPNGGDSINLNGTATRLPTTAAITSHQLYQAPVNTFDVTSSALLIDRMFAHLSRESENMREWIALEKERIAIEKTRRQQETEREFRRERALMDTLMRFQDQWLSFLSRLDPRLIESLGDTPPELKVPPPEISQNIATYSTYSNNNNSSSTNPTSKQAETDKQS